VHGHDRGQRDGCNSTQTFANKAIGVPWRHISVDSGVEQLCMERLINNGLEAVKRQKSINNKNAAVAHME
jgi:hypothetical protein